MIKMDLSGKTALVTGGATGIGHAAVTLFAQNGAKVALNYLVGDPNGPAAVAALQQDGLDVIGAPGDVSDADDAGRMVEQALADLGGLNFLINNAGTPVSKNPVPFDDLDTLDEAFWDKILSTNLIGPFRCARAAKAALIASGGAIVNTASIAGLGGQASSVAYAASKAGLINQTRNLAKAFGPDVRVNAVAPGLTRTPWTDGWSEERKSGSLADTMLHRMVEPEDVAATMLFLAINPAITGQCVQVDCGRRF